MLGGKDQQHLNGGWGDWREDPSYGRKAGPPATARRAGARLSEAVSVDDTPAGLVVSGLQSHRAWEDWKGAWIFLEAWCKMSEEFKKGRGLMNEERGQT